jgi:hypothetical protein
MKGEQETKVKFFVNSMVSVCVLVGELGRLCPSSLEKLFIDSNDSMSVELEAASVLTSLDGLDF